MAKPRYHDFCHGICLLPYIYGFSHCIPYYTLDSRCAGLYVRQSFGCITFRYDQLQLHPAPSPCPCSRYQAAFCMNIFQSHFLNSNCLNFTFSTGRVWDPWTGCELKSWLRGRLSQAQGFPSLDQDNLTAFLRKFDIPDKKYTNIYGFIVMKYRRDHPLVLKKIVTHQICPI